MSFDKIKSFWRSSSDTGQQSSFIDRTQSFISSSFRRPPVVAPSTAQFDDYLANIPKIKKTTRKSKSTSNNTVKPELLARCIKQVQPQFFDKDYEIEAKLFDRKKKINQERQLRMHEELDEVEVCLFNQITSRFDEILSVLRTIESLDCLVVQNQHKLKQIRQKNFSKVMKVSQRQSKLAQLIKKKKRIEDVLGFANRIKEYQDFICLKDKLDEPSVVQECKNTIPIIKDNAEFFQKFKATRFVVERVDSMESTLKQTFSQKVNQKILDYLKRQIPYQAQFWKKHLNSNKVLEQKQDMSSTALLDESAFMGQQDTTFVVLPKRQEQTEDLIIQYILQGWQDGEYSVQKFREQIEAIFKGKHNAFMLDFREFCDEVCKKNQRNVENPNMTNLLKQISILFCSKVFTYFFDIHKSIILRYFCLCKKILVLILNLSRGDLSIAQKQKLNILGQGFIICGNLIIRLILEKVVDICDMKVINDHLGISDIKLLIGMMENTEAFVNKQIQELVSVVDDKQAEVQGFMGDFFSQLSSRFPVKILENAKKRKLMDYLNKMHKSVLSTQLKESLENEIWTPVDIPTQYYDSLHYLITGESLNLRRNKHNLKNNQQSSMMYQTSVLMDGLRQQSFIEPTKLMSNFRIIRNDIIIEGTTYKVTATMLLLLQIIQDYMTLCQNFPIIKAEVGGKLNELIRSYNVSSCQLIVHAGAVALQKIKTKNITSRHLALSSLCLKFILYLIDCISKRVEIFDGQKLRGSIEQHFEMIVKKLNQIIVYKANQVKSEINLKSTPSKGTQSIVSNTKILMQILSQFYDKQILSRIITKQVLDIYVTAISGIEVKTKVEAQALKDDVAFFFGQLKGIELLNNGYQQAMIQAEDRVRIGFEDL